jgi:molybdenum cofactor cytidylyltransferase
VAKSLRLLSNGSMSTVENPLRRVIAVIPAAGHSRRMGQPKLLLDVGGETVIRRLIDALSAGGVDEAHVLVRAEDAALRKELERTPAVVHLAAGDPPDMRASVEQLLEQIAATVHPPENAAWLLCPADHPVLNGQVVAQLCAESADRRDAILVPTHDGRRGHPTLFPWRVAACVPQIPAGHGLNWLLQEGGERVVEVAVEEPGVLLDLDDPDDYARLTKLHP